MDAMIHIKVGRNEFQVSYVVGETSAPRAYDYGGVIQIEEAGGLRLVAIPVDLRNIQEARYWSGLYAFKLSEDAPWAEESTLDLITARLQR